MQEVLLNKKHIIFHSEDKILQSLYLNMLARMTFDQANDFNSEKYLKMKYKTPLFYEVISFYNDYCAVDPSSGYNLCKLSTFFFVNSSSQNENEDEDKDKTDFLRSLRANCQLKILPDFIKSNSKFNDEIIEMSEALNAHEFLLLTNPFFYK